MFKYLLPVLFLLSLSLPLLADESPGRVLVIYKANDQDRDSNGIPDSKDVALYYQRKRHIPDANLCGLNTTKLDYNVDSNVTLNLAKLHLFYTEMVQPIRRKLDSLGRDSIYYMVLCKGIPWAMGKKDSKDKYKGCFPVAGNLATIWSIGDDTSNSAIHYGCNPYYEHSPGVLPDKGRFDHSYKFKDSLMYLVTELDGMTYQDAKELVDRALYAERYLYPDSGYYRGIGYVDHDNSGLMYTEAELRAGYPDFPGKPNTWDMRFAMGWVFLKDAGFPYQVEPTADEIGQRNSNPYFFPSGESALTAPNAMWYGGWYNMKNGYPPESCWTWLPGAVACDFSSISMPNIDLTHWAGGAVCQGATGVCGNIAEPGMSNGEGSGISSPEKLLYFMLHGYNFAEAAFLSDSSLGFKSRSIGDPLYTPLQPKTPVKDTVAPPVPLVEIWAPDGDLRQRTLRISLNTEGREPDLALCRFRYGKTAPPMDSVRIWEKHWAHVYRKTFTITFPDLTIIPKETPLDSHTVYHMSITLTDPVGNVTETGDLTFNSDSLQGLVGISKPNEALPAGRPALYEPSPNPFNPSTVIRYSTPYSVPVHVSIYNLDGTLVASLVNQKMAPGQHQVVWNAGEHGAGLYIVRLRSGGFTATRKILLVK